MGEYTICVHISLVLVILMVNGCTAILQPRHQRDLYALPGEQLDARTIEIQPVFATDSVHLSLELFATHTRRGIPLHGTCAVVTSSSDQVDSAKYAADYFVWIEKQHDQEFETFKSYPIYHVKVSRNLEFPDRFVVVPIIPLETPRIWQRGSYRLKVICGVHSILRGGFPPFIELIGKIESNVVEFQVE